MKRPSYLSKYLLDWDLIDVMIGGKSSLDTQFFVGKATTKDLAHRFLRGYGLDPDEPISSAEIFGNFQESLQFIRRYFLKEGNAEGLDLKIPSSLYMITEISDLFLLATSKNSSREERLWVEVIFKIMHTILHVDKDLRSNYFSIIQTQIFDRFYKYVYRGSDNSLLLGEGKESDGIKLVSFDTKSKKTRESVIIKLLHKAENVAEELFDRVGVRFVTENRSDILRVIKFLNEHNVVIPHNVKPSRSANTILNIKKFREKHHSLIRMAIRNNLSEDRFLQALERESKECTLNDNDADRNYHSAKSYQSIQFTCRQLIKYKNPFLQEFNHLRKSAKSVEGDSDLAKRILSMDMSLIARDIRFFYPFEVQITDELGHKINTEGEASHQEYKKAQLRSAMRRVFGKLIEFNNISL